MVREVTYDQHPPDREYGPTVLIVDDETHARERLELALAEVEDAERVYILHATTLAAAFDILSGTPVHVILLDKCLAPEPVSQENNGIEAIPEMLRLQPNLQILMVTGSKDIHDVTRAMNLGACGYVTKEMPDGLLINHINKAIQFALLKMDRVRRDRLETASENELGGSSRIFQETLRQGEVLAESNRPVLILGDSGTGKTALAKWIHRKRGRFLKQKERPFIAVNVSTLSADLIESELFGHEKGAFTDAKETKQGLFELANNGTLFLDEIGELPLELQPKLLTVIEEGTFLRVGGKKPLHFRPKLIFATNRNLEQMVKAGTFRMDLYMRLSMFPIAMPSLSERREDIPEIVKALLPQSCQENHIHVRFEDLPQDFIQYLTSASIEGNIRGIQHQLDRLLVLSPRDKAGRPVFTRWKAIPGLYLKRGESAAPGASADGGPITYSELMARPWNLIGSDFPGFFEFLEIIKAKLIHEAIEKFGSNRERARALTISDSMATQLKKKYELIRGGHAVVTATGKELMQ